MTIDYAAIAAKAAAEGTDMTKAKSGGGDYAPPAEGFCYVRLVGYFEIGKQKGMYQGKPTLKEMVQLVFELSGPKHPPTVTEAGDKIPHRITVELPFSLNEKAGFFKLFQRLNYSGTANHIGQLLGQGWKATVIHRKYAKRGEAKDKPESWTGVAAELYDKVKGTFTIEPPRRDELDEEGNPTGNQVALKVPEAITPVKAFFWDYADKAMWDALYIEGEYPERKNEKGEVTAPAKSKNVLQLTIKGAANFIGSPAHVALTGAGFDFSKLVGNPEAGEEAEGGDDNPATGADPAAAEAKAAIAKAIETAPDDVLNGVV
jgi:hypothetical protein